MSQMPAVGALRAPRATRAQAAARPELRVVPGSTAAAAPARLLPFVLFCAGLLAAGLLALLFINMSLAQGAYALRDLSVRSTVLTEDEQELRESLATLESPTHLAKKATEIGMDPGTDPAFLDVSSGEVVGEAGTAAGAGKESSHGGPDGSATKKPQGSVKTSTTRKGDKDTTSATVRTKDKQRTTQSTAPSARGND